MNYLVNILVRTCNRPNYFKGLADSINSQTHKDLNVIVSFDNKKDRRYLRPYGYNMVRVLREPRIAKDHFPYNLYENKLLKKVESGWVMYLDDDDMFTSKYSLQKMFCHIRNEDSLLLWRVQIHNRVVPEDVNWKKLPVKRAHISGIGFMFNSKYKDVVKWDDRKGSDYRVIHKLTNTIPNIIWIDEVLTSLQIRKGSKRVQGLGNREDKAV